MTTDHNEEQELKIDTTGPGDILREARERLGMSQEDVANRLRLRTTVIADIENNIFDTKQATFTRGYIRSFAKCVNLDEDQVLSYLNGVDNLESADQKMHSFSRRTKREAHDNRVMRLTWVIAAGVLGVTAIWWWQSVQLDGDNIDIVTNSPATEIVTSTDDLPDAPLDNSLPELVVPVEEVEPVSATPVEPVAEQEQVQPVEQEAVADVDSPAVVDAPEVSPVADEPAPQSDAAEMLSISFKGDCWVDIRDATGKRLVTGIKKQGESIQLEGQEPFKLVLGAPDVVELRYQGEVVDMSQFGAGKVARFNLPL
ncbi:cytoskeleton protein RodZ [Thaumasiovibrio subtropicus]|uniref:cytoskeleton protein RodZ n=1 Tax=Thaumasiovibrio subtropicus TaxID=1891207 RepID=UPI000B34C05C|nr:cytoskeleton protein RodZ [Thaumasiovibrio subtropicus]